VVGPPFADRRGRRGRPHSGSQPSRYRLGSRAGNRAYACVASFVSWSTPAPWREQRPLHPGRAHAWHTHPNGQTIYVLEGVGLAQRRGGPVEVIRPGDRVFFEPGEDHWHGAAPNRFMTL
jgi:redox-sensitive bicupin YhaK (pirin superfamily)